MSRDERIKQAITDTAKDFSMYINKSLEAILGGKIIQVEGLVNAQAEGFDRVAGIDMLLVGDGWSKGIAGRRQPGKNWQTFTIRRSIGGSFNTEYKKKRYAIENGCLYPSITVHAYMNNYIGAVDFAIASTADIFECIKDNPGKWVDVRDGGNGTMYVVEWDYMQQRGMDIRVYRRPYNENKVYLITAKLTA